MFAHNSVESESIEIICEAVATARKSVMMYSIGKDSSVMLHLARKAPLPRAAAFSVAARGHGLEIQGHVRVADVYPRFGPTSKWGTAAAQAVLEAAGGAMLDLAGQPLQ